MDPGFYSSRRLAQLRRALERAVLVTVASLIALGGVLFSIAYYTSRVALCRSLQYSAVCGFCVAIWGMGLARAIPPVSRFSIVAASSLVAALFGGVLGVGMFRSYIQGTTCLVVPLPA